MSNKSKIGCRNNVGKDHENVERKNEAIYTSDEDSVNEVVIVNNETIKRNVGTNTNDESFLCSVEEMMYKAAKKDNEKENKKDDEVYKIIEESTHNNTINSNYEKFMIKNEEVDLSDNEIVISSDEEKVEENVNERFVYMATPTTDLAIEGCQFIESQTTCDNITKVKNKKGNEQEKKKTQKVNESKNSHFYDCDFEDLLDNLKNNNKKELQEQKTKNNSKKPRIYRRNRKKPTAPAKDKTGAMQQTQGQILRKLLHGETVPTSSSSTPLIINQGLPMVTLQGVPLPVAYGTNVILVQYFKPNIQIIQGG